MWNTFWHALREWLRSLVSMSEEERRAMERNRRPPPC
jgi:hypothetical protein